MSIVNTITISPLEAFEDNYIWLGQKNNKCFVVDPGDATIVEKHLQAHPELELATILITHHHFDHTGGVMALKQNHPNVEIYGPNNPSISGITHYLKQSDTCNILNHNFSILEVPGHTLDHISYYCEELDVLFCGDTLFVGGCGRLFEGTAAQMYKSLEKLVALPDATKVYCTHEYTLANLQFAKTIEANNQDLIDLEKQCIVARSKNIPTVPSTIGQEKSINPFLRSSSEQVIKTASQGKNYDLSAVEVFTGVRTLKDHFRAS